MAASSRLRDRPRRATLSEYYDAIKSLGRLDRSTPIRIIDAPHFTTFMRAVFEMAKERVAIYSDTLGQHDWRDGGQNPLWADTSLIEAARAFLRRSDADLHIMVRSKIDADNLGEHPFLSDIINDPQREGIVTLLVAGEALDSKKERSLRRWVRNFGIADDKYYWLDLGREATGGLRHYGWNDALKSTWNHMVKDLEYGRVNGAHRPLQLVFEKGRRTDSYAPTDGGSPYFESRTPTPIGPAAERRRQTRTYEQMLGT